MSRETTLIFLALLATLSPFVGLPYSWLMVIVPVLGLFILSIAIVLRIHRLRAPASVSTVSDENQTNA